MAKSEQSDSKEISMAIATSTSPGTVANTVALAVVLWCSIHNMFPPLRARTAISSLEEAIKEAAEAYDKDKSALGDSVRLKFQTDFKRLEFATLHLEDKYIQSCLNLSWASLPRRVSDEKYAWVTARAYRRGVNDLKTWLQVSTSSSSSIEVMLTARAWIVRNRKSEEGPSAGNS
ncbi:hypothetical protein IW262DRAFT_1297578 [Armillaria fumosa]|nr:hypothetical protein IW262DRAFT_1297578 [Armillaria fumosa]